jgi:singapore isolate B (sub-type 7) whole genome shotgun sequence assembly, scaffold_11
MSSDIGIYGLTSQGIQLALNFASKGYLVTVGNKSSDKVRSDLIDI